MYIKTDDQFTAHSGAIVVLQLTYVPTVPNITIIIHIEQLLAASVTINTITTITTIITSIDVILLSH